MKILMLLASLYAQEGTLDVLDGETLYQEGWLFTLGREYTKTDTDALDRSRVEEVFALGAHYGLRYDIQLSAIFTDVTRIAESGSTETRADGPGDAAFIAKWRFHRWDAPGIALNFAALVGMEVPTGSTTSRDHGIRVSPELQPGSGSWDPSMGIAVTHEPGRWRFNAALLYGMPGEGAQDYRAGNVLFAELAAGNRFWLTPYPGPFWRFDALLRYRHQNRSHLDGNLVSDSGGDLLTAGATLAFRPRPTLDFQLFIEFPLSQDVNGLQPEEGYSLFFVVGYRI